MRPGGRVLDQPELLVQQLPAQQSLICLISAHTPLFSFVCEGMPALFAHAFANAQTY